LVRRFVRDPTLDFVAEPDGHRVVVGVDESFLK
jgi:hypothetical protein